MTRIVVAAGLAVLASPPAFDATRQVPAAPVQDLVRLHVVVTEEGTLRPVEGLAAGDFEIVANGRPVPVAWIDHEPPLLSLVLLFDLSASVSWLKEVDVRKAIDEAVAGRLAVGDRIRLGRVAAAVDLGREFVDTGERLSALVEDLFRVPREQQFGPSPLWDGLDAAVTILENEPGRRVVVLVTDGRATGNRVGVDVAVRRAILADVAVCVVGGSAAAAPVLRDVAALTGGAFVVPNRAGEQAPVVRSAPSGGTIISMRPEPVRLETLLAGLVDWLHGTYALDFEPPIRGRGSYRLDVRVGRPGVEVHVRTVYGVGSAFR